MIHAMRKSAPELNTYRVFKCSLAVVVGWIGSQSVATGATPQAIQIDPRVVGMGHPTLAAPVPVDPSDPEAPEPFVVSGPFVSFESPPVKPLALSADGSRLFAVNTPNNRLVVMDTTDAGGLRIEREIVVGLDPVSVAVQPGTPQPIVWVANMLSDTVSVVDTAAGRVIKVIEVGDEPVNIVFSADGAFAFVILQGSPIAGPGEPLVQEGALVAIDTATLAVVSKVFLDCHTPRAAVRAGDLLVVAALHSGNNTSVAGEPIRFVFENPDGTTTAPIAPLLAGAQAFELTAGVFANPDLSPYPDPASSIPEVSPLVMRVVEDAGGNDSWQQIVDIIDADHDGSPDADVIAALEAQFPTLLNAEVVLQKTIDDVKDTVDHDLVVVNLSNPAAGLPIIATFGDVGATMTGMGYNAAANLLFVSNMSPRNTVRLEPNLRGHLVDHQMLVVNGPGQFVKAIDLHQGVANFNDVSSPNAAAQAASLANPTDVVFNESGTRAYVAALGTGRVAALDGVTAQVLGRVDVGRGPRGLALDSASNRLYVLNRTDLSISVVDVSGDSLQVEQTAALFNPEPAEIREGRDFLYSTRFSHNYASACATCHIDGTLDHRGWDLGDPGATLMTGPPNLPALSNHPVKGTMVTLSLAGLDRHEAFHWRSDRPTFLHFNPAFDGLLGGSELSDEEMEAFAAFIMTVNYPPNPYRNRDNSFKDSNAVAGQAMYVGPESGGSCVNCNTCHQVANDGAMKVEGVEADAGFDLSGLFAQLQEVPQLRGINKKFNTDLYGGFGLLHDGREERESNGHPLQTFLLTFFPGLSAQQRAEMVAFVTAFPTNVLPVVGWQVMASAPTPIQVQSNINQMITQHEFDPSRCDVVAHGIIAGRPRGFYLSATEPGVVFTSDMGVSQSMSSLLASLTGGNSLVFTAVPPGSGKRIGVDQDVDGLLDGLDPMPQHNNDGDVNADGRVDGLDLQAFVDVVLDPSSASGTAFHGADVDNDEEVDLADLSPFAELLIGS